MSRKRSSAIPALLQFASLLPWWLSLGLPVISGVLLHQLASAPVAVDAKQLDVMLTHSALKSVAMFAQFFVPIALLGAAIASFAGRRNRQRVDDAQLKQSRDKQPRPEDSSAPIPVQPRATPVTPAITSDADAPASVPQTRKPRTARKPATKPKQTPVAPASPSAPACPHCRKTMVMKVARSGPNAGGNFWGCTGYPQCRGIRAIFAPLPSGRG